MQFVDGQVIEGLKGFLPALFLSLLERHPNLTQPAFTFVPTQLIGHHGIVSQNALKIFVEDTLKCFLCSVTHFHPKLSKLDTLRSHSKPARHSLFACEAHRHQALPADAPDNLHSTLAPVTTNTIGQPQHFPA